MYVRTYLTCFKGLSRYVEIVFLLIVNTLLSQLFNQRIPGIFRPGPHRSFFLLDEIGRIPKVLLGDIIVVGFRPHFRLLTGTQWATLDANLDGFTGKQGGRLAFFANFVGKS